MLFLVSLLCAAYEKQLHLDIANAGIGLFVEAPQCLCISCKLINTFCIWFFCCLLWLFVSRSVTICKVKVLNWKLKIMLNWCASSMWHEKYFWNSLLVALGMQFWFGTLLDSNSNTYCSIFKQLYDCKPNCSSFVVRVTPSETTDCSYCCVWQILNCAK